MKAGYIPGVPELVWEGLCCCQGRTDSVAACFPTPTLHAGWCPGPTAFGYRMWQQCGFTSLPLLWVKFWGWCIWLAKLRPAKEMAFFFFSPRVHSRPYFSLRLKWWGIPQTWEDSSEGEQPKKLQMSSIGGKHRVLCAHLSHSLILSDLEKHSQWFVGLPFLLLLK